MTTSPQPKQLPQKVTQLQCQSLDSYFKFLFHSQLLQAFKYLPQITSFIQAELQLLINFMYYRFTIGDDQNQPGNILQNIQYCNLKFQKINSRQKLGFLLLDIILPYIRKRLQSSNNKYIKHPFIKKLISYLDGLGKIIQYINFIIFIKQGVYRSITMRIFGIRMKFIQNNRSRILDFSLMNRQLIWNVYESFLNKMLPFVKNLIGSNIKKLFFMLSYADVDENDSIGCAICSERQIVIPQINDGCKHMACYYCTKIGGNSINKQKCKICGVQFSIWKSYDRLDNQNKLQQ